MNQKDNLIKEILERELEMFTNVPVHKKASCQEQPEQFRIVRRSHFLTWSTVALESYLEDLKDAEMLDINLMTQKYARMENLIPPLNDTSLIDKIVTIQLAWQREMFEKYPDMMRRGRKLSAKEDSEWNVSFETYLKSELETYSQRTLGLIYEDLKQKWDKSENMTEEIYSHMVRMHGYDSIEKVEESIRNRTHIQT